MSSCCIVPTGNLLTNLISYECVRCEKCRSCHHCFSARRYLRDNFLKQKRRSVQKFIDTEEDIDLILDAILDHQSGFEPPRYIFVGSHNIIEEKFPISKETRWVPLLPKQNIELLPTKLTNPQTVTVSVEPVVNLPSKSSTDEQTTSTEPICELIYTESVSQKKRVKYPTAFSCEKCKKCFPLKSDLKIHETYHKIEEVNRLKVSQENAVMHQTTYRCDKCEKTFTSEKDLNIHNVYHSVEQVHKCEICDCTFKYSYELIKHRLKHTEKNMSWVCKPCKKTFRNALEHTVHMGVHTNEKPFVCEICEKRFDNNFKLKAHFRIHTGEKPFPCERCTKTFRTKSHLQSHNLIHDNVKNYRCFVCEKLFRHNWNLKTHLSRCHDVCNTNDNYDGLP